jgi:methyl-accepting chemotaxis protein
MSASKVEKSLQWKLIVFVSLLVILLTTSLTFYSYTNLRDKLKAEKRTRLRHLTDSALGILSHYQEMVDNGELTTAEAKQRAQEELSNLRFGSEKRGYFWLQTQEPRMLMHPFTPELEGKNLAEIQDEEGNYLFSNMVEIVEKEGAGFLNYNWQYYGNEDRIEPKLSYVEEFAPWGWIVGTGLYIDDIQASLQNLRRRILIIGLGFLILALVGAYLIGTNILAPLEVITKTASLIAAGNLKERMPAKLVGRKDEIGLLARTFNFMGQSLEKLITDLRETKQQLEEEKENLYI